MDERASTSAFEALSDVVLAIASEREVGPILQKLVHAARELVGARFAALGIPDGEGGFADFITSGMSDAQITAIGPLPRTHGMLGAMLETPEPYRTDDVQDDPRFGGWPANHPQMRSFLGVPIVSKGEVIAAFYLTDRKDAPTFSADDQRLIELFAAHAAVAITNARLFERSGELTVIEERNRLARDLHDAVSQKLFSANLTAEVLERTLDAEPGALDDLKGLIRSALDELRSLVFELRPADLTADGLVGTLRKHVDVLRRVHPVEIDFEAADDPPLEADAALTVFRIAQEALSNALKHSRASRIEVDVGFEDGRVLVRVRDDGRGFDPSKPSVRSRHLGLTTMEERARGLGGTFRIDAAAGEGTAVCLEVPLDG